MKYEDFIGRFPKHNKTGKGVLVCCPAHDDSPKTPSLSVSPAHDGGVLIKCFAACSPESVVKSLGLTMKDLFATEKAKPFTPPVRNPGPVATEMKPVIEKIYSYQDATGKEVYQAIRLKPKSFRQRHMVDGKWVWTMDGVERVLYRLPEVLKSKTVWICEGEKDCDNLVALGFCATCNVGGAGKWLDGYTESLVGKDVVICGDTDEAGKKHVELVFNSIAGVVKTVRIFQLPTGIKDVSDFIATFKDSGEAKRSIEQIASDSHPHLKGIKLPVYTISELEQDYKRFVSAMVNNSFSLSNWLPSFHKIRPLVPGELVFIIGDTGTGKTGILQQIASSALPLPTLLFEMELPKELMFERFAAMSAGLACKTVEENYRAVGDGNDTLTDILDRKLNHLFVCTESRLTVQQIENYIMRSELKIGERPKVVLIDYIQLITGTGVNRREKISDIAEQLKVMAKTTRTIIIVASQIARDRENPEPHLHSGKESGSIESSCGLLIGAWRDKDDAALFNLRVLKSTKGGNGLTIPCNFDGARMIITERSPIDADDYALRKTTTPPADG